jgi:hypothetical protein
VLKRERKAAAPVGRGRSLGCLAITPGSLELTIAPVALRSSGAGEASLLTYRWGIHRRGPRVLPVVRSVTCSHLRRLAPVQGKRSRPGGLQGSPIGGTVDFGNYLGAVSLLMM